MSRNMETEGNCECDPSPGWKFWKRRRYVVAFLGFFGFFNIYALRANLSIAIVAMTENKTIVVDNETTVYVKEFDWDSKIQGYVLSSFFYGYITTQLFGGWFAMKVGGKNLFGIGVGGTAFMTVITPFVANISVYLLIAVRILEGICEGFTYPSIHAIWSQWAPPYERSRLATLAFGGAYVGTVVAMPTCALLADKLGWSYIFYVYGGIGLLWYLLWQLIVSTKPSEDPRISTAELNYITKSLGTVVAKEVKHPWKSIFSSTAVWAIVVAHTTENWGFYTLLTQLPKYMKDILNYDLASTGYMTAIPYLAMSIVLPICGQLADWLLIKNIFSITTVRKLFNCLAFLAQTVFMISASYATSAPVALACLTAATGLGSFAIAGWSVNYLDVAPQHASVLMGIGNTVATLPGILSPILSGYIVTTPTREEWRIIFYVTGAVYLFGSIFYAIFADGELQPWAAESQTLKSKTEKSKEDLNGIENGTFKYEL
ncbi:hypothetical protein WA026_008230 [Henosepilachna vigintioctopunctata]|uniref:Sialin n=1 Tax=Henosepilachna vigintioctopunctata TaxID=420089 RepID=A0AAW1TKP4_9CUCU